MLSRNRVQSGALRLSGMVTQFLCGVLVAREGDHATIGTFFTVTSAVPLLVLFLGLELHTGTDRLIARGLSSRRALLWLGRKEATWVAIATVMAFPFAWALVPDHSQLMLVYLNGLVGLAVQELFRVLVLQGLQSAANGLLILRNTAPFLVYGVSGLVGSLDVTVLLVAWLVGGVAAGAVGFWRVRRHVAWGQDVVDERPGQALPYVLTYFPATMGVRALLSADVLLISALPESSMAGVYGNLNALILAFFTLNDVFVLQWRMRETITTQDHRQAARLSAELRLMAVLSMIGVIVGGAALMRVAGAAYSITTVATILLMSFTSAVITLAQGMHLRAYAEGRHEVIRRTYAVATLVFVVVLVVALFLGAYPLLALAKAFAWASALLMLYRPTMELRRGAAR